MNLILFVNYLYEKSERKYTFELYYFVTRKTYFGTLLLCVSRDGFSLKTNTLNTHFAFFLSFFLFHLSILSYFFIRRYFLYFPYFSVLYFLILLLILLITLFLFYFLGPLLCFRLYIYFITFTLKFTG